VLCCFAGYYVCFVKCKTSLLHQSFMCVAEFLLWLHGHSPYPLRFCIDLILSYTEYLAFVSTFIPEAWICWLHFVGIGGSLHQKHGTRTVGSKNRSMMLTRFVCPLYWFTFVVFVEITFYCFCSLHCIYLANCRKTTWAAQGSRGFRLVGNKVG